MNIRLLTGKFKKINAVSDQKMQRKVQDKMQSLEELFMYRLTLKIVSMRKCTFSQMRRSCSGCTWLPPFLLLRAGQITVCLYVPDGRTPTNQSEGLLRGRERSALLVGLRLKFVQGRRYSLHGLIFPPRVPLREKVSENLYGCGRATSFAPSFSRRQPLEFGNSNRHS